MWGYLSFTILGNLQQKVTRMLHHPMEMLQQVFKRKLKFMISMPRKMKNKACRPGSEVAIPFLNQQMHYGSYVPLLVHLMNNTANITPLMPNRSTKVQCRKSRRFSSSKLSKIQTEKIEGPEWEEQEWEE